MVMFPIDSPSVCHSTITEDDMKLLKGLYKRGTAKMPSHEFLSREIFQVCSLYRKVAEHLYHAFIYVTEWTGQLPLVRLKCCLPFVFG